MKIGVSHSKYIANQVAVSLNNSPFVKLQKGFDVVVATTEKIIFKDLKNEATLEERVREIIDKHEDEIEYNFADEKELFRMIKHELAPQYNFMLSYDERFNHLAYNILKELVKLQLIQYKVSEIKVKSLIFDAIESYIQNRFNIEERVAKKIQKMKRKLIPGTDGYYIVFQKFYEEELKLVKV